MQEMWVRSPGREDPLQKEEASCSSILAWEMPRTVFVHGSQKIGHNLTTKQQGPG